jgi:metal-responsive CopG/Arc/MetJ family transcriptional regulator
MSAKPRFMLELEPELLERVIDWQHEQRLPSRAAAIRQMLETASVMRSVKRGREIMAGRAIQEPE